MKKITSIILSMLCLIMSFCFVGCEKTGSIPNGFYYMKEYNIFVYTENSIRDSYGWEINGYTAERWMSGSVNYKAKIVEKDGVICFGGYQWRTLLDILFGGGKKQGSKHSYIVVYNETEKSITLTPVDIFLNER